MLKERGKKEGWAAGGDFIPLLRLGKVERRSAVDRKLGQSPRYVGIAAPCGSHTDKTPQRNALTIDGYP